MLSSRTSLEAGDTDYCW